MRKWINIGSKFPKSTLLSVSVDHEGVLRPPRCHLLPAAGQAEGAAHQPGRQPRQVSCDWSTPGHVTTMITSDWSGWRWGSSPPRPRSCAWTGRRTRSWPGIELQTNLSNNFTITDLLWAFSWHLLAHSYLIHHAKKVLNTHG